jgi:hypothetical protein
MTAMKKVSERKSPVLTASMPRDLIGLVHLMAKFKNQSVSDWLRRRIQMAWRQHQIEVKRLGALKLRKSKRTAKRPISSRTKLNGASGAAKAQ